MADLRALTPALGLCIALLGYYSPGDGGDGVFCFDSSSTGPDNGGTVIRPNNQAIQGRWLRLIHGPLSVKWFGARGDGLPSSNDTTAIQRTFDAVPPSGGGVYFPPGIYNVMCTGSAETLSSNHASHIFGSGYSSRIHQVNTTLIGYPLLRAPSGIKGLRIENLRITQIHNSLEQSGNGAIHVNGEGGPAEDVIISGVYIEHFSGDALVVDSRRLVIQSNVLRSNNGNAFYGSGQEHGLFALNQIEDISPAATTTVAGLKLQGPSGRIKVIGNSFIGTNSTGQNVHAILVQGPHEDMVIVGNTITDMTDTAIRITADVVGSTLIESNTIRGKSGSTAGSLVWLGGGRGNIVKGNLLDASQTQYANAIYSTSPAEFNIIEGNLVRGSAGWAVSANASHDSIRGNTVISAGDGIQVGGGARWVKVISNHLEVKNPSDITGAGSGTIVVPDP